MVPMESACGRSRNGPAVALAALVAVLNLSIMAGRLGGASPRHAVLAWRAPACGPASERGSAKEPPANPTRAYNAGRLALGTGIAVIALAAWLHVMRINGATGR